MEEKLLKIFKYIKEYSETNPTNYMDFEFDGDVKRLQIRTRKKENYDILEDRTLYLDRDNENVLLDKLIEDLENY